MLRTARLPILTLAILLALPMCTCDTPPQLPAVPVITSPAASDIVLSPVTVTGTADASAMVTVEVMNGATSIGSTTLTANAAGAWTGTIPWAEPAPGTALKVQAHATSVAGDSGIASVDVVQGILPPTLTTPTVGTQISTPVHVDGTGYTGAIVGVAVLNGAISIGTGGGIITGGVFSGDITYAEPGPLTNLTVAVNQSFGGVTSLPVLVSVVQRPLYAVAGTVSQSGGAFTGTTVRVAAFAGIDDVINPVAFQDLVVTSGAAASAVPYSIDLPAGSYVLRAWRDSNADGDPTIGPDAQTVSSAITVAASGITGNLALDLVDTSASAKWSIPSVAVVRLSPDTTACGGTLLWMAVTASGSLADLGPPKVKPAVGAILTLLDDGACGAGTNASGSFDPVAGDGDFSIGRRNPVAGDAGDYIFHGRNTADDFIEAYTFTLESVVLLNGGPPLTSPAGDVHVVKTLDPEPVTLDWPDIPGATHYRVTATDSQGGFSSVIMPAATSITTIPVSNDDLVVKVTVAPQVKDSLGRVIASSWTVDSFFVLASTTANLITYSGALANDLGAVPIVVQARGGDLGGTWSDWHASTVLPSTATSYSLEVLSTGAASCPATDGEVLAFLNVDGSGLATSQANLFTQRTLGPLDSCGSVSGQDASWRPLIVFTSPINGATGVGATPTFSWTDYETTYQTVTGSTLNSALPGGWAYLVMVQPTGAPQPTVIWTFPGPATSFSMASLPTSRTDIVFLMTGGVSSSAASLAPSVINHVTIGVVPCAYNNTPCLAGLIGNPGAIFATSPIHAMTP